MKSLPTDDEDLFPWGNGIICGYCAAQPAEADSFFCSKKCRNARAREVGLA